MFGGGCHHARTTHQLARQRMLQGNGGCESGGMAPQPHTTTAHLRWGCAPPPSPPHTPTHTTTTTTDEAADTTSRMRVASTTTATTMVATHCPAAHNVDTCRPVAWPVGHTPIIGMRTWLGCLPASILAAHLRDDQCTARAIATWPCAGPRAMQCVVTGQRLELMCAPHEQD